jgi:hypothetical protein
VDALTAPILPRSAALRARAREASYRSGPMAPRALIAILACVLLLAGCGSSSKSSTQSATNNGSTQTSTSSTAIAQLGFEGVPIEQGADLASPGTTGTATVDGIHCGPSEQLVYHIHSHLTVYVHGTPRSLPGGIGIPGSRVEQSTEGPVAVGGQCIYWLHTHAPDGIIHVESPVERVYTLGQFFDEWRQPLSANRVASASGRVTAFVNGKPWTKNIGAIPLLPHAVIQLNVGSPAVPFRPMSWARLQL